MAATVNGNTLHCTAANDYLRDKDLQVNYIIFNPHSSGDSLILYDMDPNTAAVGSVKLTISATSGTSLTTIDLSNSPIRFPNGIWVGTISTNSEVTIIFNRRS